MRPSKPDCMYKLRAYVLIKVRIIEKVEHVDPTSTNVPTFAGTPDAPVRRPPARPPGRGESGGPGRETCLFHDSHALRVEQ